MYILYGYIDSCYSFGSRPLYELMANILGLIGAIYLLYRIGIFLKTILELIRRPQQSANKSIANKISGLCHCRWNVFRDC